jgi:hypothetical protein
VERCLPRFAAAGLPSLEASAIGDVQARSIASLWAGMGNVYKLTISSSALQSPLAIVAKRVELPRVCSSIGDQRKKDSYDVEAAFYARGHAERLIAAGALVPFPLHVEATRGEGVTICSAPAVGLDSPRPDAGAHVEPTDQRVRAASPRASSPRRLVALNRASPSTHASPRTVPLRPRTRQ